MSNQYPNIIKMSPQWFDQLNTCQAGLPDGRYVPARALGWSSWTQRWKAAWIVFTGRADALIWPGQ